ncbi:hypothetical protein BKA70DRAFT_1218362 [Coprinopsis sp. MPI-PUGE-AT-0042]|nr:hypothetical protein BKA70DRAFT_1218362 [Coprinopsis sp. MPI-PUGE-AT-0042]
MTAWLFCPSEASRRRNATKHHTSTADEAQKGQTQNRIRTNRQPNEPVDKPKVLEFMGSYGMVGMMGANLPTDEVESVEARGVSPAMKRIRAIAAVRLRKVIRKAPNRVATGGPLLERPGGSGQSPSSLPVRLGEGGGVGNRRLEDLRRDELDAPVKGPEFAPTVHTLTAEERLEELPREDMKGDKQCGIQRRVLLLIYKKPIEKALARHLPYLVRFTILRVTDEQAFLICSVSPPSLSGVETVSHSAIPSGFIPPDRREQDNLLGMGSAVTLLPMLTDDQITLH